MATTNVITAKTFDKAWEAFCDGTGSEFTIAEARAVLHEALPNYGLNHLWHAIRGYAIEVEHIVKTGPKTFKWQVIPAHLEDKANEICAKYRGAD